MFFQTSEFVRREQDFYKRIIRQYLTFGSVDAVFKKNKYNLPISYAGMHRLIKRWGIIKSAGPNPTISEAVTFLMLASEKKISVARIYKSLPPSFKTSLKTIHRILHNVKEGITRRNGTALVVVREGKESEILLGEDITPTNKYLGKPYGALTLPMTYSADSESCQDSILRVLQQEVFSDLAVEKKLNITDFFFEESPFMRISIADISVLVYKVVIPKNFKGKFSSYKVTNHRFCDVNNLEKVKKRFRLGVEEIIEAYKRKYLGAFF